MIDVDTLPAKTCKKTLLDQEIENIHNFKLEFEYYSDFKNTKILRDFIEEIGKKIGLQEKVCRRLILIADEMNNNAIEYGSRPEDKNTMAIAIHKTGEAYHLHLQIIDSGNGPYKKTAEEMYAIQEKKLNKGFQTHTGIRWRGLFQIIHKSVDKLYFKNASHGGLVVGIEKIIKN